MTKRKDGIVPCWHPSQNRRALENFLNYAEARVEVEHAPPGQVEAMATIAWLRTMLRP